MRKHKWKPPITLWNGEKPDVSYFRTFGCLAYVFIPKDIRKDKLAPKSAPMIFIGYEQGTKGYRFWSQTRHHIVISQNATFDEQFFPNCPKEMQDKPPSNQNQEIQQHPDEDPFNGDDDDGHHGYDPPKSGKNNQNPKGSPKPLTADKQPDQPPRRSPPPPPARPRSLPREPSPPPAPRQHFFRPEGPRQEHILNHPYPQGQFEFRACPQYIKHPNIKPDSVYGDKTPVEIEQDIQTEQDFVK